MTHPYTVRASSIPYDDARAQRLLWSLERALRHETRALESSLGVSSVQLWALYQLHERPATSLSDLALRLGTHPSSASATAKQLEARGLVRRSHANRDHRRLQLTLTPAGKHLVLEAPVVVRIRLERALAAMAPENRQVLATLLESWFLAAAVLT